MVQAQLTPSCIQAEVGVGIILHMDFPERTKGERSDETFSQTLKRNPRQALIEAEEIIMLAPENANGWFLKGMALSELNRCEEALRSFDTAIRLRPDLAEAWQGKGGCLLGLHKYEEALAALEKAPNTYLVCYQRGCALGSLGRYNESMDALQAAIRLNHDDQTVLDHSRSLLESIGRHREALKANEETGDMGSDHDSPHTFNSPT
jgi:tetratricopeptide (TPR) repeat protein